MNGSYFRRIINTASIAIFIGLAAPVMAMELQLYAQNSSEFSEKANGKSETATDSLIHHRYTDNQNFKYQIPNSKHQIPNTKSKVLDSAHTDVWIGRTDEAQLQTANYHIPSTIDRTKAFNLKHSNQNLRNSIFNIQHSTFALNSSLITSTSNSLPFHLQTNRLGTVDPNSTNFLNRIRATGDLNETENFKIDYGTDLALRISENSTVFFPELYLGAEYGAFRLDFGRFDRPIGLNNHDLSIGSMMVSRNAVPIPRIIISNPEFTDIPWTEGIVQFKGLFSHGWFTDERYTDSPYLHQKFLYLKVNAGPISTTGGIVHNAQWGGTHPTFGRAPQSFDDYLRIVLSRPADPSSNAPPAQISNALGNSIAAYEFAMEYEGERFDLSATRLFYLEDSVSKRFRSPWDGVWGVNLSFDDQDRLLNAITYEHINTRRQDAKSDEERGRAGYYNHSYYRSGWSHHNRTIGIPLITRDPETDRVDNNIIVGHHMGITGQLHSTLRYKILGTYTRNYGIGMGKAPRGSIDFEERREDNYSLMLELGYTPKVMQSIQINASIAFDTGEFYGNRVGGEVGVRYTFD